MTSNRPRPASPQAVRATDPPLLRLLLGLHAVPNPRILDASYGRGVMWRRLPYRPVRLDVRAELDVDLVGSWCDLARLFPPASFDVVVWDPPHLTDAGQGIAGAAEWADRYGTHTAGLRGASIAPLFGPFLRAARAVLEPAHGIVLVKVADQVHDGAQQWQHVELIVAARALGWTACDYAIKTRAGALDDPKWRHRRHVRKPWSFWIVLRPGSACSGPGEALVRVCQSCGQAFRARRADAQTCGARCRQRRRRARRSSSSPRRG